ncbi:MAG: aldolase/citrate lyase family protein [Xanthobacteraceae bacterium]
MSIELCNPALERMRSGDVALGMVVRLGRSGDIARIAKASGHDFIFVDSQHALYSLETIGHISQTALGCGVTPMVRTRGWDDPNTSLLLDNGVLGIIAPDVSTAAQARAVVDVCKFPPIGKRSVSGGYPMFDFRALPLTESLPALNDKTLVICMIETVEGLANVEQIAAVPGVDVVHIGCNDLLVNMGNPGAFGSPEIMSAIERVIAAANKNGIFAGLGGDRDPKRQAHFIRKGVKFVTTQTDIAMLTAEATRRTEGLRVAIKG